MNEPGIYRGVSYEDYAAWGALRCSGIWPLVNQTPAHYLWRREHPEEPTPAMKFGTAFHTKILEPFRFDEEYIREADPPNGAEKWDRRTKIHKAAWAEFLGEAGAREVLSGDDWDALEAMRESVFAHEEARKILEAKGAEMEVSFLWEDKETNRLLQGRADICIESALLFADAKTAKSADAHEFDRSALRYGYFMQASLYHDGLEILWGDCPYKPQFIVVEKEAPFVVDVCEVDYDDLEFGRQQYRGALKRLEECEAKGEYPGYSGVRRMQIPPWAKGEAIIE